MHANSPVNSRPPGTLILDLRTAAIPENLKEIRTAVRDAVIGARCSENCADEIVIAVNEACMNVIEHGYALDPNGLLTVQLSVNKGNVIAWLGDQCAPIELSELKSRSLDDIRPGGLGVHFMRECMDDVSSPKQSLGSRQALFPPAGREFAAQLVDYVFLRAHLEAKQFCPT